MKILFYSRLFYPHIGGVEKHVMEISTCLIARGHKVTVVTEKHENGLRKQERINGIDVYRINTGGDNWFKKFRIWREVWRLRKLINGADIIHCHDVFFWFMPFRFVYPYMHVYTTFHGYESYPIKKNVYLIHKISEKMSRGNICIGDFFKKWYRTNPTIISYGGTSFAKLEDIQAKAMNRKSAIFIGRLEAQVGVVTYADTVNLLRKKYPEFYFTIIGEGKDRQVLKGKFKFLGFQKNPNKYLYKYHFAFVSRYLSILEAFMARRLVFAVYDTPLKEDYLKMAPFAKFIIIEKDPAKLAEKVEYYLEHPKEEKELIEKAYQWVQEQTWEKVCDSYLRLWQR